MHLKIFPLLETLRALVECEDLSSSTKWEARDFGLTVVLQLKTQWAHIIMMTWPEPWYFLRSTGAEQIYEKNLSLSPTRQISFLLSILCVCVFCFYFELFILGKYSASWIIMSVKHFTILWEFCCICQSKCSFIWTHTFMHIHIYMFSAMCSGTYQWSRHLHVSKYLICINMSN